MGSHVQLPISHRWLDVRTQKRAQCSADKGFKHGRLVRLWCPLRAERFQTVLEIIYFGAGNLRIHVELGVGMAHRQNRFARNRLGRHGAFRQRKLWVPILGAKEFWLVLVDLPFHAKLIPVNNGATVTTKGISSVIVTQQANGMFEVLNCSIYRNVEHIQCTRQHGTAHPNDALVVQVNVELTTKATSSPGFGARNVKIVRL